MTLFKTKTSVWFTNFCARRDNLLISRAGNKNCYRTLVDSLESVAERPHMRRKISRLRFPILFTTAALMVAIPLYSAATSITVNLDAALNGVNNPIELWLAAGTYQIDPIEKSSGGKFDARNAWNGNVSGCNASGFDCLTGWQWALFIEASDLGLSDLNARMSWLDNRVVNGFVGGGSFGADLLVDCVNSCVFATPEIAFSSSYAYQFSIESSGYVSFFDGDTLTSDNIGGVSFNVVATPGPTTEIVFILGLACIWYRSRSA